MASLFDLLFDNNNYYRKSQYNNPYKNYFNNYDTYNNYYKYPTFNDYDNYISKNNKYNNNNNYNHSNKNHKTQNNNNKNNNTVNNNNNIKSEFSIKETNDSIIIETCLPNVDKKDIQIEIRDSKLIIQGQKKASKELVKINQEAELPTIEEYEEDKEEDKGKTVIYKYITIKTPPKVVPLQQDSSLGPFKKSLDLSDILPYLNLRNINSSFNNNILSIKISKLYLNNNYSVRIF